MKVILLAITLGVAACAPPPQMNLPAAQTTGSTADIVRFCRLNQGRKVGDGQCWALANESFKAAGIKRPTSDLRVWGRVVNPKKESLRPGDVIEYESARFSDGIITGRNHTAIVITGGSADHFTIAEQNFGGTNKVSFRDVNLNKQLSGKVTVYRPR